MVLFSPPPDRLKARRSGAQKARCSGAQNARRSGAQNARRSGAQKAGRSGAQNARRSGARKVPGNPLVCLFLTALAAVMLTGSLAGCGDEATPSGDNQAPAITGLAASPISLEPGGISHLELTASDPEGDALSFAWTAPAGIFTPVDAAATTWTAPSTAGKVDLTCTVTDSRGQAVSFSVAVTVVAVSGDRDGDGVSGGKGDCNDFDATVYPGAPELADGQDNDCDGVIDEGFGLYDEDGDGFSPVQGDCDDTDPAVYPGVPDPVDGIDNNCDGRVDEGSSTSDEDHDGFAEAEGGVVPGGDCDDARPDVHPGAAELPDGVDNDCNGQIDEHTVLSDDDSDGYTEVEGDCDDTRIEVYPGALEVSSPNSTDPPLDENCDGRIDEGLPSQDLDGDGFPIGGSAIDCDDYRADVHPGAPELPDGADNDCDGSIDEGTALYDDDGDGWSETRGDCNDGAAGIYPGGLELSDGFDNDCDGLIDEDTDTSDDDSDGFTELEGDCDDRDPRARPDYPEVPDEADNDCDGGVDEDTILADADQDGFTLLDGDCDDLDPTTYPGAIDIPGDGKTNNCQGGLEDEPPSASIRVAGVAPKCASVQLDGSGSADPEGLPITWRWYQIDGPGALTFDAPSGELTGVAWSLEGLYRVGLAVSDGVLTGEEAILVLDTAAIRQSLCAFDADDDGYSVSDGDCNDDNPAVHPGAVEVCDGVDQDCDGREMLFDEPFSSFDPTRWALNGSASIGEGDVVLTQAARGQTGSLFYKPVLDFQNFNFTVTFELLIEGGTSGSGMTFAVIDAASTSFLGKGEGGLGLAGLNGWGIELDTDPDEVYGDPGSDHIALDRASDLASDPATVMLRQPVRSGIQYLEVRFDAGAITVLKDDVQLFTSTPDWNLPSKGYIGFTAATGTDTDRHHVQRVTYECR